ncbi:MAG: FliH/SctL family protein [Planctomycetota bacterium]|nr:FliH/SctL family protein [Planctomycetota bacterium]
MPLIKARDTRELASPMPSIDRVESSASVIIERARQDASRIIALALEEARSGARDIQETARQQGYEQGHQEGVNQGHAEGQAAAQEAMQQQLKTLHNNWSKLLVTWEQTESKRLDQAARLALEMAMSLGACIVHRQVAQNPEIVVEQLRRALELAQSPSDLEILVAESDRPRVHQALPGLLERFENTGFVSIRACADMAPGGCRLMMRGGEVDASLEVQLQRLTEAIMPAQEESGALAIAPEGEAA